MAWVIYVCSGPPFRTAPPFTDHSLVITVSFSHTWSFLNVLIAESTNIWTIFLTPFSGRCGGGHEVVLLLPARASGYSISRIKCETEGAFKMLKNVWCHEFIKLFVKTLVKSLRIFIYHFWVENFLSIFKT